MARRAQEFQTVRSEGGLLPMDLLRRLLDPKGKLEGTSPSDYGLAPGDRLNETITQSWTKLQKHWADFTAQRASLPIGEPGTGLTNDRWTLPLLRELGFGLLPTSSAPEVGGRSFPINRFFGPVPIHLVGCGVNLDRRAAGVRGAATANPHGLVQEFLNRSSGHLWALLSDGLRFRILRDHQALSRQSFLEFDLEAMFQGEVYADFVVLWLIAHATRFAPRDGQRPETCWLEEWAKEAEEQGTRALEGLRVGVEKALQILGEGFTSHPKNAHIREALRTGAVTPVGFHGQLLRVVYRLIFLFVAEDRTLEGQPVLHPRDESETARLARVRYEEHYSARRLRELASAIKGSRHTDLWRQLQVLVRALSGDTASAKVREQLALPTLGSFLWDPSSTATLNDAELTNFDLLEALRHLAFTRKGTVLRPVDYKNLGAEELGGVYESLLALTPQISADGARFTFAEFAGNERKTSGSYYTPDSLVQCLLDSALDPVVEMATTGKSPADAEQAILALKVCDPAVGSGHFLVGAAHRLARHLSRVRAVAQGESEASPLQYQHALRDVIGRCLYGVDVNPMAAELCRVSLWLEALEPGRPLSFLEHHIRVGNSLLGATPALIADGIPDAAFHASEGDDKAACVALRKLNELERHGLNDLFELEDQQIRQQLLDAAVEMDAMSDASDADVRAKTEAFHRIQSAPSLGRAMALADLWCAAFVVKKQYGEVDIPRHDVPLELQRDLPGPVQVRMFGERTEAAAPVKRIPKQVRARVESPIGITTGHLRDLLVGNNLPEGLSKIATTLARQYQFFHWHLAFPEVFSRGGFDCMLGNPPWVRQELLKPYKRLLTRWNSFSGTADSSVYFLELSLSVLRPGGRVAILTPNKWFRASYATGLRTWLRAHSKPTQLIDFGHSKELFPDADTFPAGVILERVLSPSNDEEQFSFAYAPDVSKLTHSLSALVSAHSVPVFMRDLRPERWTLESSGPSDLLRRLLRVGRRLDEELQRPIIRGLLTGFNEAFYVSGSTRATLLSAHPQSAPLFRKFLRGRDVRRWRSAWADQWHIVIASSQNTLWPWSREADETLAERIFAECHPSLHAHLKAYELELRSRQDRGTFWWELRACDYYDVFESQKLVVQCIAYYSQFAFDSGSQYVNNKVIVIPTGDLYVLGVLNSRVTWWVINRTFQHMKDDGLSIDVQFLRALPIPLASLELRTAIRDLVEKILGDTSGSSTDSMLYEVELNRLVGTAFGLTDEEHALLDQTLPKRDPLSVALASVHE
jgi:hypothetical protein